MSFLDSLRQPRARRYLIFAALWAFVAVVFVVFRQVLIVFAVAMLLAYVLSPAVRRLSSVRIRGFQPPRWLCVILLYATFFVGVYLFSLTVVPQVYRELRRITAESAAFLNSVTPEKLGAWEGTVRDYVEDHGIPLDLGPADEAEPGHMVLSIDLAQAIRDGLERMSHEIR
jgi:predicted PurR-regulated permease PerM